MTTFGHPSGAENGYVLLVPFIDESESFTLGFEAGKVWGLLEVGEYPERMLLHSKNVKQVQMLAEHFRCDMFVDPTADEQWCYVTFAPKAVMPLELVKGSSA